MVVTLYGSEGSVCLIDGCYSLWFRGISPYFLRLLQFMVQRDQSVLLMVVTLYGSEGSVIIIDGCYTLWFRGMSQSY